MQGTLCMEGARTHLQRLALGSYQPLCALHHGQGLHGEIGAHKNVKS